jgi:GntR family transcriptional regulator/MocR family aminotransferase
VPEDFPFNALARIMRRTLAEKGERILAKSPPLGTLELRGAIRRYLSRSRALDVDEERILIGSGAEALYSLVVQLLGRDTVFALEDPCWEKIRRAYEANGARCAALEMDAEGIAQRALDGCPAGALHVTPYHSYPSGITASADRRAAVLTPVMVGSDTNTSTSTLGRTFLDRCSIPASLSNTEYL